MKRVAILVVVLLLAAAGVYLFVVAPLSATPEPVAPAPEIALAEPAPPKPEPELPLPTLRVLAGDAGVEVVLRGAAPDAGCETHGTEAPLCPGQYDVRAVGAGQIAMTVVRLQRGDAKTLELPLQPALTLSLMVIDTDKLPVDRVRITAQHPKTGFLIEGKTDSDGTLVLGPVTPGDWSVHATRDGYVATAGTVTAGNPRPTTLQLS